MIYLKGGVGTIRAERTWEEGEKLCWEARGYRGCVPKSNVAVAPPRLLTAGGIYSQTLHEMGLTIDNVRMVWQVAPSRPYAIVKPKLEFEIRNVAGKTFDTLFVTATFLEPGNVRLDRATSMVRDLKPTHTSERLFLDTSIGYTDLGGTRAWLERKTLEVELYFSHRGHEQLIIRFPFAPSGVE